MLNAMFWWLLKFVLLGPVLRLVYRARAQGLDNVPSGGGAILVANHLSALDTLLLPIVVPNRKLVFLGKAELFDRWYTAWFFRAVGVIPVRRGRGSPAEDALRAAVAALGQGQLVGIFPEGTRSPDGRLYRGKTGVARIALQARVAVIPVGIVGTRKERGAAGKRRIEIRLGKPLHFGRYYGHPDDRFVARAVTDEAMYEIMLLSGQEYVDEYADRVKERVAREPAPAPEASLRPGPSERSRR